MSGLIYRHMKSFGQKPLNLKFKARHSAFFSLTLETVNSSKRLKKIQKEVDLLCLFLYTIGATAWTCEVAGTLKPVVMEQ